MCREARPSSTGSLRASRRGPPPSWHPKEPLAPCARVLPSHARGRGRAARGDDGRGAPTCGGRPPLLRDLHHALHLLHVLGVRRLGLREFREGGLQLGPEERAGLRLRDRLGHIAKGGAGGTLCAAPAPTAKTQAVRQATERETEHNDGAKARERMGAPGFRAYSRAGPTSAPTRRPTPPPSSGTRAQVSACRRQFNEPATSVRSPARCLPAVHEHLPLHEGLSQLLGLAETRRVRGPAGMSPALKSLAAPGPPARGTPPRPPAPRWPLENLRPHADWGTSIARPPQPPLWVGRASGPTTSKDSTHRGRAPRHAYSRAGFSQVAKAQRQPRRPGQSRSEAGSQEERRRRGKE